MFKHLSVFALALVLFASCDNTNTTETTDGDAEVAIQPAVPAAAQTSEMRGENYVVKVVDATIKSPRKELSGEVEGVPLRINYGSPAVNERTIYGDLVPYKKVWRTGANEATRITFDRDVMVGEANKRLAAGTYALFTLPDSKDEWTVIFNKVSDQWGAYDYEEADDVARIRGMAKAAPQRAERMDFMLEGNNVALTWDDLVVTFPIASASK